MIHHTNKQLSRLRLLFSECKIFMDKNSARNALANISFDRQSEIVNLLLDEYDKIKHDNRFRSDDDSSLDKTVITHNDVASWRPRIQTFETGALSPIVHSIHTTSQSLFLGHGVGIVDVPGTGDTDQDLLKVAWTTARQADGVILVAQLSYVLANAQLPKQIRQMVNFKGARNVCVVLTRLDEMQSWPQQSLNLPEVRALNDRVASTRHQYLTVNPHAFDEEKARLRAAYWEAAIKRTWKQLEHNVAIVRGHFDRIIPDGTEFFFVSNTWQSAHTATQLLFDEIMEPPLPPHQTGIAALRAHLQHVLIYEESKTRKSMSAYRSHTSSTGAWHGCTPCTSGVKYSRPLSRSTK